ncbi:MAG: anaerobic ribonucleoside-triphosphate reductase activating protein [Candidatus Thorarchaeota archaeon]
MRIGSILDLSLVDVPKIPVSVIFTAGCNFDCPYCHNAELLPLDSGKKMSVQEIVSSTEGNLIDGFCITGGEPTIQKGLVDLTRALKEGPGGHINLNTQGSVPKTLQECISCLDSVWLDVKSSPDTYQAVTRTKTDWWPKVAESIKIVLDSDVELWPRTTYVGGLMTPDDLVCIGETLDALGYSGDYLVQNYVASAGIREDEAEGLEEPDLDDLAGIEDKMPSGIELKYQWR